MTSIERRDTDTSKSYAALCDYAAMGAGRSLSLLAKAYRDRSDLVPTRQESRLGYWSAKYDWQARVALYDAAVAAEEHAAREAELAERRAAWVARQMEADEVLARLADFGRSSLAPFIQRNGKGEFIDLDLSEDKPLHLIKEATITKRQIGELITETTTKIKVYDAHAALVKLGEHHKLFGKTDDVLKYIDLSKLSPAQLDRIAQGEDPLAVLLAT